MSEVTDFITIKEVALRLNCSERHVERLLCVNDKKKTGLVKVGRRMVRVEWGKFMAALTSGTMHS